MASIEFEQDKRWDSSNRILFIHAGGLSPFTINADGATFEGTYDASSLLYKYTITINVSDVSREIVEALYESHSSRYFVAFRPTLSNDDYIVVGFKNGCELVDSYSIGDGNEATTITLSVQSQYPLLFADERNFNEAAVRTIIYRPLYTDYFCELEDGTKTGYKIARYATGYDSAGNPLDADGIRCDVSQNQQVAYKLEGEEDGDYEIIGTFSYTDSFNGEPVSTYDLLACNPELTDSISVEPDEIWLNDQNTSEFVQITSTHSWVIDNYSEVGQGLGLYDTLGGNGDQVRVWSGGQGGTKKIIFKNSITTATAELTVHINLMAFGEPDQIQAGDLLVKVPFTHSTESEPTFTTNNDNYTVEGFDDEFVYVSSESYNGTDFTITATVGEYSVSKAIYMPTLGNTDPVYMAVSRECSITNRGYVDVVLLDTNQNSQTYGQKILYQSLNHTECPLYAEPSWYEIGERCEGDDKIVTYVDLAKYSLTRNQIREERVVGGCGTDPDYVVTLDLDLYPYQFITDQTQYYMNLLWGYGLNGVKIGDTEMQYANLWRWPSDRNTEARSTTITFTLSKDGGIPDLDTATSMCQETLQQMKHAEPAIRVNIGQDIATTGRAYITARVVLEEGVELGGGNYLYVNLSAAGNTRGVTISDAIRSGYTAPLVPYDITENPLTVTYNIDVTFAADQDEANAIKTAIMEDKYLDVYDINTTTMGVMLRKRQ